MRLGRKKLDPIADRARKINNELASLKGQINKLNASIGQSKSQPRLRSTILPQGHAHGSSAHPAAKEPVFEEVDHHQIKSPNENQSTPAHFNDWGVRKYDLAGALNRLLNLFRSAPPANPQFVNFLAAGSLQGPRPMRYERLVARKRFFFLVMIFFLFLWGAVSMFMRNY